MSTIKTIFLVIVAGYFLYIAFGVILYSFSTPEEKKQLRKRMKEIEKKRELKRLHKRLKGKWYQRWFDPSDPGGGPAGPLIRR